jgi:Domain of Unknown Function (DUF1206)
MTDLASRLSALNPFRRRRPKLEQVLELAARVGYGARGFVYLSIGLVTLLAAVDVVGSSVGSSGAIGAVAEQPFGRLWLILLGIGLWAFVLWRVLQSVFDADHEGRSMKALMLRGGQAVSGIFYGVLAATVFEVLDEYEASPTAGDVAENQEKAAMLLDLPFGDWLLIGAGLVIAGVGVGNILKGIGADFGEDLACTVDMKRRFAMIARAGYVARGLAYLPLALFVTLAGFHARAEEVTSFGSSLDALEAQPGGSWLLGMTAVGLMAFGCFAFVEARYRRIRPPKDLNPL